MALEAMTFQQELLGYGNKDFQNVVEMNWGCDFALVENEYQCSFDDTVYTQGNDYNPNCNLPPLMVPHLENNITGMKVEVENVWDSNAYLESNFSGTIDVPEGLFREDSTTTTTAMAMRPRRRRSKTKKNKEEIENQRMTHIAVERNRRKQMNEYICVLRGLMPESYAQKGDQASTIGGAINYVKELEQQLHLCSGRKHINNKDPTDSSSSPFSEFFNFPQYSTAMASKYQTDHHMNHQTSSSSADIEVTIVDNHANLKIRSKKRLKQLSRLVCGLENHRLTILHLNVTSVGQTVLYSLSLKVEDDCMLTSADEIAAAVNGLLGKIQEQST